MDELRHQVQQQEERVSLELVKPSKEYCDLADLQRCIASCQFLDLLLFLCIGVFVRNLPRCLPHIQSKSQLSNNHDPLPTSTRTLPFLFAITPMHPTSAGIGAGASTGLSEGATNTPAHGEMHRREPQPNNKDGFFTSIPVQVVHGISLQQKTLVRGAVDSEISLNGV